MHLVTDAAVAELLTAEGAIAALRSALAEEAAGTAAVPVRTTMDSPTSDDWLRTMPCVLGERGYMGTKLMYSMAGVGVSYLILLVNLHDRSRPVALVDANTVTKMRTAATAAVATDLLVSGPVDTLAVVGTGEQALSLLDSLCTVRDFRQIRVFSRREDNRARFVAEAAARWGVKVVAGETLEGTLDGADVIGSAIRAGSRPIFRADMFEDATVHLNALSSVRPGARELDADLWAEPSFVVVDHPGDALESGDVQAVMDAGSVDYAQVPALSDLVTGRAVAPPGTRRTVFKSVGSGLQDVSVAAHVYETALRQGAFQEIDEFPAIRGQVSSV
jgi:ornithine cyclodeaminase/alanine dehydrogenase-like protein (mu-crystallin family)